MDSLFDVCIVLNNAESLLPLHYKFWETHDSVRLLIGNTNPLSGDLPKNATFVLLKDKPASWTQEGFDGYLHGHGIDQLIEQSTAEYLIIQDADVFWLKPNITEAYLAMNVDCFGIGDVYDKITGVFPETVRFPNDGAVEDIVPFCSGMIVKRDKVLGETFKLTYRECQEIGREVGWRIRDKMKQEGAKVRALKSFCYPPGSRQSLPNGPVSNEPWFPLLGSPPVYGSPDDPWIIHFTQFYFRHYASQPMFECLRHCSSYWASIL